jgi:hypothetical protein
VQGSIPLAGYSNINAGFTALLANPIILDISHRYVIAVRATQFDITQYTTRYTTFNINSDIIEYQYEYNKKTELLGKFYGIIYIPPGPPIEKGVVNNLIWKFINPTQKVISRINFWITDSDTGLPLVTPALNPYPTEISFLIKKVNTNVVAVSAL